MFDLRTRRTYLLGKLLPHIYPGELPDRGQILDAIAVVDMAIEELDRPKPGEFPPPIGGTRADSLGDGPMQIRERGEPEFSPYGLRKPVQRAPGPKYTRDWD